MLRSASGVFLSAMLMAPAAYAETSMAFSLDWKLEGPAAPYFLAIDKGYFKAEGLTVDISEGAGSLDAIPKVATGAFPVGFADINSLMKFLDQNPGAPVTGVMMVYDKPPFAMIGRKSLGIEGPKDILGKTLGAPPSDGAWAQFPIFAAANGIAMDGFKVEPLGFPVREPMLAEGKVDAVMGFSYSVNLNLKRLGVPAEDITTVLLADHGVDLYGNVIIANTDFAKANPEALTGFIRAVAKGWQDAATDPNAAIDSLLERSPVSDRALETERLQLSLQDNVFTDYVKANGIGNIDPARMATAIEQTKTIYEFKTAPDASLYFDSSWLPKDGSLTVK